VPAEKGRLSYPCGCHAFPASCPHADILYGLRFGRGSFGLETASGFGLPALPADLGWTAGGGSLDEGDAEAEEDVLDVPPEPKAD
jgi:hypothetical protein